MHVWHSDVLISKCISLMSDWTDKDDFFFNNVFKIGCNFCSNCCGQTNGPEKKNFYSILKTNSLYRLYMQGKKKKKRQEKTHSVLLCH